MNVLFFINQLDYAILHSIQAWANPIFTLAMLGITFLGSPVFWVGIAAGLYWKGQENKGFFMMNLVVFAAALAGILKYAFLRPRPSPCEFNVLASDGYNFKSFPSGHATMIAAAFSYTYKIVEKRWKLIFAAVVVLVAFSRLYLGMHFPTDVIAGIALGLVVGKINLFTRDKLFHKNFRPSKLEDELALIVGVVAAIAAIFFLRSVPMAGLFIGFYAGFFLLKEIGLVQSILLRKFLTIKYVLGFTVLLGLLFIGEDMISLGIIFSEGQRLVIYIVAGLWISFVWPLLFEIGFRLKQ